MNPSLSVETRTTRPSRAAQISRNTLFLRSLTEAKAIEFFAPANCDALLKTTVSLCPECLGYVPAAVFTSHGAVQIKKFCESCGFSTATIESDERYYHLSNKDSSGVAYATDRGFEIPPFKSGCCEGSKSCGPKRPAPSGLVTDQSDNKTCVILVEVTNACNMQCKVCYADAKGDRYMPIEEFKTHIRALVKARGGLDSMQITGGEATLHPGFWEMLEFCYGLKSIKKIYIPTNGIELSKPGVAERLKPFRDRLLVLLQFDSERGEANSALRASNPTQIRGRAIENLARAGVFMQLTMTLVKGVNEQDVGAILEKGFRTPEVKVIAFQPATYSGRFEGKQASTERLTLSDVVKEIDFHTGRMRKKSNFVPIPCSHPNCGWVTLYARRFGLAANIMKYIDLGAAMERVSYKTLLSSKEIRDEIKAPTTGLFRRGLAALGKRLIRAEDVLTIAVKPFMDRFSYDQDRVANCCHHIMTTKGEVASFCEYNAVIRQVDSWERLPTKELLLNGPA